MSNFQNVKKFMQTFGQEVKNKAEFPNEKILRMAIVAGSTKNPTIKPIPPCGACRQALSEYEVKQNTAMELYFMGTSGQIAFSKSVENILPWVFDKSVL